MEAAEKLNMNLTFDHYYFMSYLRLTNEVIEIMSYLMNIGERKFDVILEGPYAEEIWNLTLEIKNVTVIKSRLIAFFLSVKESQSPRLRDQHPILHSVDFRHQ
jgi:hypothetical protein